MNSLPAGYSAAVVGATGALGAAFVQHLRADPRCAQVHALHRHSIPPLDYGDEASVAAAAAALRGGPPLHLLLVATGVLHGNGIKPEKRLADLDAATLQAVFQTNVFGPALVLGAAGGTFLLTARALRLGGVRALLGR